MPSMTVTPDVRSGKLANRLGSLGLESSSSTTLMPAFSTKVRLAGKPKSPAYMEL